MDAEILDTRLKNILLDYFFESNKEEWITNKGSNEYQYEIDNIKITIIITTERKYRILIILKSEHAYESDYKYQIYIPMSRFILFFRESKTKKLYKKCNSVIEYVNNKKDYEKLSKFMKRISKDKLRKEKLNNLNNNDKV